MEINDFNGIIVDRMSVPVYRPSVTFTELRPLQIPDGSNENPMYPDGQSIQVDSELSTNRAHASSDLDAHIRPTATVRQEPSFSQSVDDYVDNNTNSRKIKIKHDVRKTDRLRTRGEQDKAAHFIQCEDHEDKTAKYPAIKLDEKWATDSDENYIDVTLLNKKNETHLYEIDYKRSKTKRHSKKKKSTETEKEGDDLIEKVSDCANTLRFRLTDDDFKNGFKSFKIQIIKSTIPEIARKLFLSEIGATNEPSPEQKQEAKEHIQDNELNISKLCFTRLYRHRAINREKLCVDDDSTVYSSDMNDISLADLAVSVADIIPRFGPMKGGEKLAVFFKNIKATDKEKLLFKISDETNTWSQSITDFQVNASAAVFHMPAYQSMGCDSVKTIITVYYKDQPIFNSEYIYSMHIDNACKRFNVQPVGSNENDPTNNSKAHKRSSSAVSQKILTTKRRAKN